MDIILGAVVSLLVQGIKKYFLTDEYTTLVIVVGVSFLGAILYVWLIHAGLWESFLRILVAAGAMYTYIIQRFKDAGNDGMSETSKY